MLRASILAALAVTACASRALGETVDERWTLGVDESITWETVSTLSQESADAIADEYAAKEVHPVLEFRCSPSTGLGVRIDWRRFVSSFNTEVGFRVDGGEATWLKMGVDPSNRMTLARSAGDVDKLIEELAEGKTLLVEVAPYSEPSVVVRFDVSALTRALRELEAACG